MTTSGPAPLPYAPTPVSRRWASHVRGGLIAVAVLCWVLGAVAIVYPVPLQRMGWESAYGLWGTPVMPINSVNERPLWYAREELEFDRSYVGGSLVFLGVVLWAQWALLSPAGSWRPKVSEHGRPALRGAIAAGLMAMLVSVGILATVMEFAGGWSRFTARDVIRGTGYPEAIQDFRVLWVGMGLLWLVWGTAFWGYFRTVDHRSAVARVFRWLVAGSVLNVMLAGPVHATRTGDCYCAKGSYTGLVFGLTVAVWLFGPAVFLLYWREVRRADGANIGYVSGR